MSNEAALDFILYQIQSDNQPLGIPFGWSQPKSNDTITLGSVYVGIDEQFTPKSLLLDQEYDFTKGYFYNGDLTEYPLWGIKKLLREWKNECKPNERVSNKELRLSAIFGNEEIHCLYDDLDREEKLLYHLAIMALNTMTECHNWAVSYLEYLAYNHYNLKDHGKNWSVYNSQETLYPDIFDALNDLLGSGDLAEKLGLYGYTIYNNLNDECYHYFNQWEDENTSTQEFIKNTLENSNKLDSWDIREYDHEIIGTLAAMMEWIKSEWLQGNLSFELSEDMPKDLYNWYSEICN